MLIKPLSRMNSRPTWHTAGDCQCQTRSHLLRLVLVEAGARVERSGGRISSVEMCGSELISMMFCCNHTWSQSDFVL